MATVKANQVIHKAGPLYQLTANQASALMNSSKPIQNQQVVVSESDIKQPEFVYVEEGNFTKNGTFTAATGKAYNPVKVDVSDTPSVVATPTFTLAAGTVASGSKTKIECTTVGASIYYTTDGTTPSSASTAYDGTDISITETVTIKAIAVLDGYTDSDVASAAYVVE